ncbi:MAG: TolC family protein [Victivallales bacterium]|nr:TolC family protein [Victivallales bacterium]
MRRKKQKSVLLACMAAGLACLFGCRSAKEWRNQADERAAKNISSAQKAMGLPQEKIHVETPADTLRRRLMLDQNLYHSAPVSASIRDMPSDKGPGRFAWKNEDHLGDGEAYEPRWDTTKNVKFSLADAIMVAAKNSREFQAQKDNLFQSALALDLENHEFQTIFRGTINERLTSSSNGESRTEGITATTLGGISRTFKNGAALTASISADIVKMLSHQHGSSWGPMADASISIPLMRGSGEFVTLEPLKQAERNLVYQLRSFEQYKRSFVVNITSSYLSVLQSAQTVKNQEENYKRVVTSTRRSRRMADAGRMAEYQFDQALQNELSAQDSMVRAQQSYQNSLDSFKVLLGLPPDALVEPDPAELTRLQEAGKTIGGSGDITDYTKGNVPSADDPVELPKQSNENRGPYEIPEEKAIRIALEQRPDLQTLRDRIGDAKRRVLIARDNLRAEVTIGASVSMGEGRSLSQAGEPHGKLRPRDSFLSSPLTVNLPWERTMERNAYRNSILALEQAVRNFQNGEDEIKQNIRNRLRTLAQNRSSVVIQREAVELASRRVDSTTMLLEAGRVEMRDVLEAQNALLSAQNSLISVLVNYRMSELSLQRDLGTLQVSVDGIWSETDISK